MSIPLGIMVYWRPKGHVNWRFGYTSNANSHGLIRMGRWNGDTTGGYVVSVNEIEWKEYL